MLSHLKMIHKNYSKKLFKKIIQKNYSQKKFKINIQKNYSKKIFKTNIQINYSKQFFQKLFTKYDLLNETQIYNHKIQKGYFVTHLDLEMLTHLKIMKYLSSSEECSASITRYGSIMFSCFLCCQIANITNF